MRGRLFGAFACFVVLTAVCSIQTARGDAPVVTWDSYKEVEVDFGDSLLRVGSNYQTYAYATGSPTGFSTADPKPEQTEITEVYTADVSSGAASSVDATASAVAAWFLEQDLGGGIATLSNAAAGTSAIVEGADPGAVALSWATQSTTLDLGTEVEGGVIDWTAGAVLGAAGGSFASAHDRVAIHDPVVVWTRAPDGSAPVPNTIFEMSAVVDGLTRIHWNDVKLIDIPSNGPPTTQLIPRDGPVLDASEGGTGIFRLSLGEALTPQSSSGLIELRFADGIVTESRATGAFAHLSPPQSNDQTQGKLPRIGEPARLETIELTPEQPDAKGRYRLTINAAAGAEITDVAACSQGVHIKAGPGVDQLQPFTLNPLDRAPVDNGASATADVPRGCWGEVDPQASLMFDDRLQLPAQVQLLSGEGTATQKSIDRFARLQRSQSRPATLLLSSGVNETTDETRRWSAQLRLRVGDNKDPNSGPGRHAGHDGAFSVGLLDRATYGDKPQSDLGVADLRASDTSGMVVSVVPLPDGGAELQLWVDGQLRHLQKNEADQVPWSTTDWGQLELRLQQRAEGVEIQVGLLDPKPNGATPKMVKQLLHTTVTDQTLSKQGYRLAVSNSSAHAWDVDDMLVTFQQRGDVAWDGRFDGQDVRPVVLAIDQPELVDPMLDLDLDGKVTIEDALQAEALVTNKLPGDVNLDGMVTGVDFAILAVNFEVDTPLWSHGNFNGDEEVGFDDFLTLARNFGKQAPLAASPVPEPSAWISLGLAGAALLLLRTGRRSRHA